MDLTEFAEEIGDAGPVTIAGLATRGGPVDGVRTVMAPVGIESIQADEMTVQLRRRHAGRRARRRAGGARSVRRRPTDRNGRWCARRRAERHPAARLRARPRRVAAGAVRLGRRRDREGGRADGEERERLRPVPSARRVARHARLPGRRDHADPAARLVRAVVHDVRRPVGDRACAVPTDVACSGTARRRGCCSRATPATSPTRRSPRRS